MISVNSWLFLLVVIFLNYDFDNKKSSCVDAFFDASKYRSRPGIIIAGQNLLQASANNNNNGNNNLNIVNGNRNNVNNRNNKINNRNNANNSNNKNRKNNKRPTLNQNQSRVKNNNNNNNTKTNQVKRPKNLQIINVKLSQFDLMETKRLNETYSILNKLKNYDYYITQDLTPTEPDISAPDYQYPDSNENIQPPPNLYPIPQEYPILNSQYDPAIDIIPVTVSSQPTTIVPINKVNNNNQDNSNNEDYSDQGYIYPQPQYNNLQYGQKIYTQQLPPLSTPSYNFQQQNHLSNSNNIDKNVPESSPILTTPTLQLNNYEYKIQTSTSSYDRNYDYNHVTPLIEQQQKTVSAKSYDNSYYPPIKYNIPAFRPLKPIYYPQTAPDIKKQQQQQQQQQYQYQHQSQQPRLLNKSPTAVQANSNIGEHDHSKEQLINRETNYYSSFLFNSSPDKIGSSIFGYPLIGLFEPNSNLNFWNILGRRKRTSRKT